MTKGLVFGGQNQAAPAHQNPNNTNHESAEGAESAQSAMEISAPNSRTKSHVIIMIDSETCSTARNAVVHQLAFMAVDSRNLLTVISHDSYDLPVQVQIDSGRHFEYRWLQWIMGPKVDARVINRFLTSHDGEPDELLAKLRSFARKIQRLIDEYEGRVEIWCRGTDFDLPNIEGLLAEAGIERPWAYHTVRDLRTPMKVLGIKKESIDHHDIVEHIALEDCRYQLRQLIAVFQRVETVVDI